MTLRQFLLILRLRWLLVTFVALITLSIGTLITLRLPKVFTSQTSLLLDVKSDPLVATFMPAIASPAFIATQSHIIRSDRVAASVVKRLGLSHDKDSVARWQQETGGKIPLDIYFSNMLQRGLTVEPAPGTSVLNISFTASDPRFAAVVATAYAQAYIDFSVDLRVEPARQYANWFDQRLKELRNDLEEAKLRLAKAQQTSGVVSSDSRVDEEITKLNTLQVQLASAVAERTDMSIRARNSGRDTSPDVQESTAAQNLKAQVVKLEAEFADVKGKYGPGHPQYQQIEGQLTLAKQQLVSEMRRVSATSATFTHASEQKVADLRTQVEEQKKRVFNLRTGKDDIDVLFRDVEATQRAYDAVAQRRTQLNLESQSDQAGARILSAAVEPLAPSKPKTSINILASLLGGLGLGAALACAIEFLDRRIRSVNDLKTIEGLPVLVVLSQNPTASRLSLAAPRLVAATKRMLTHSPH
jgi:chain length determinant protein EpsF